MINRTTRKIIRRRIKEEPSSNRYSGKQGNKDIAAKM